MFDTGYNKPFFWIMRPNISSNIMTDLNDEELGMSIFANSIDTLKAIDSKYDGFDWEFVLGRKKVFVSAEAWTRSMKDGKPQKTFDLKSGEAAEIEIRGRHDPAIPPRIVPVAEAMMALVLADHLLRNRAARVDGKISCR